MSVRQMPLISLVVGALNALFFNVPTAKAIREQIADLMDRAEAIVNLATEEKRELSDTERREIDEIMGVGKKGEAGYKAGKIDQLETELERVEKVEARAAQMRTRREGGDDGLFQDANTPRRGAGTDGDETPADTRLSARVRIPAEARFRHKRLTAFQGPRAEEQAYMAGMFFLATIGNSQRAQTFCRDLGLDIGFRGALTGDSNHLGGYVVPHEMEQTIIDLRERYGIFRRKTRISPMASDTKSQPRRTGGLTAYFDGDNVAMTESEKSWDQISLTARKLYALCRYPNELNEDAIIDLGDDLTEEIAHAFANKEDECGFNGDGSTTYGKIVGLKNALAAGSKVTAAAGNTAFSTLDQADFINMIALLPEYPGIMPEWYISKAGWAASMLRLAAAAGGNTAREVEGGYVAEYLGYPVNFVNVMNRTLTAQTSTSGLCYFGDLRMATVMGNRRGMSVMLSDQRYFEFDQIGIKGTQRFDINVHSVGTATEAGAIVQLNTPGA